MVFAAESLSTLDFECIEHSLDLQLVCPSFVQNKGWWNLHLSSTLGVPVGFRTVELDKYLAIFVAFRIAIPDSYSIPSLWWRMCDFRAVEYFSHLDLLRFDLPSFVVALSFCFCLQVSKERRNWTRFSSKWRFKTVNIRLQKVSCPTLCIAAAMSTLIFKDSVLE